MARLLRYGKLDFIPAAGNCNNGKVNDVGEWGNVWSSSLNTDNVNNAWNFNFDSDEAGVNNNNRCNGQSVRGVVGQHYYPLFYLKFAAGLYCGFFYGIRQNTVIF